MYGCMDCGWEPEHPQETHVDIERTSNYAQKYFFCQATSAKNIYFEAKVIQ